MPTTPRPVSHALRWLHEVIRGAHDLVQTLRAYAKAVCTGRVDLQRYLELLGPGGTGKGMLCQAAMALVGLENTFSQRTEISRNQSV